VPTGQALRGRAPLLFLRNAALAAMFVYGYVYTYVKLGNPYFGRNDFFRYMEMIGRPFDFAATRAPFVLRQIPSLLATVFYRLGAHYDGDTVTTLVGLDDDTRRRFMALVLSNAVAVCLCLATLATYLRCKTKYPDDLTVSFALFGAFSAWFWFASVPFAPVTVGWGWLVTALLAVAFWERSLVLTGIAAALAVFTRETALVFALAWFASYALLDRKRAHRLPAAAAIIFSAGCLYLVLRVTLSTGYEHQISPPHIFAALRSPTLAPGFLFQSVLSQALFVLLWLAIAIRDWRLGVSLGCGMAAILVAGLGAAISEFAMVTGESLPAFVLAFFLTRAAGRDTAMSPP